MSSRQPPPRGKRPKKAGMGSGAARSERAKSSAAPVLTFSTRHPSALELNDEAKRLARKLADTRKRFADYQRKQQADAKKTAARMKLETEQSA